MGLIDLVFYITGIIAVSVVSFRFGQIAVRYVFENWIPYVRITLSLTDTDGVKRSKKIWLDKRVHEDADLIKIIDRFKSGT